MVPLGKMKASRLRMPDHAPHRSIALAHALSNDRPGLWGDDPERPTSILWIREGDEGGSEVFAAGVPEPALGWLARRLIGRPIALLAPPSWEVPIRSLGVPIEVGIIQTWRGFHRPSASSKVEVRRLTVRDGPAFEAVAPPWALRSWGDYRILIGRGLAFGVPMLGGFAALAWTYESDEARDKIGVATSPRFRRLGLGRSVAFALLEQVVVCRRRLPVWVTTPTNTASIALARSLGFSDSIDETLLRWIPGRC